jgi:uncharacterized membrane protein YhaH (DUF805 family)
MKTLWYITIVAIIVMIASLGIGLFSDSIIAWKVWATSLTIALFGVTWSFTTIMAMVKKLIDLADEG